MEQVRQPHDTSVFPVSASDLSLRLYISIAERILSGKHAHIDGRTLKYAKDRLLDTHAITGSRHELFELSHIVAAENGYQRERDRGTPEEFRFSRSYGISGFHGLRETYLEQAASLLEQFRPAPNTKPF